MESFRFAKVPSHSSVVAGVTTLVSAWFLVAAGTLIADPTAQSLRVDPPREEIEIGASPAPKATHIGTRERIVVTASRSAAL
jgi:hypothetical protein